ncbi:MAG: alpha-amylase family glycosyl hydrolase, partial [Acutalibacteraceae bacterium]
MKKFRKVLSLLLIFAVVISAGIITVSANQSEKSKEIASAGEAQSSGITVHYYCENTVPYIYYWNSLPENIEVSYPGEKMTKDSTQGDSWYTKSFTDLTKVNLLFTDASGKQLSKELTRGREGEFWYKDGRWYSTNPDNTDPVESVDFREETIYFVITTRFYDGDTGNNVHCWDDQQANNPDSDPAWRGDFKGLAEKLDYIKALGFSAIWITPVVENASGYDYHGYHAMNFSKVDPRYESSDYTYDDLIYDAHKKGMKIIQDVVWNHTGNFGESYFCDMFTKDYSKDLSSIEDCMVPTQYLLDSYGLKSADEYWSQKPQTQYDQRLNLMKNTTITANNSTGVQPDSSDYEMNKISTSDKYNA